jgi:hypothetical protein
MNQSVRLIELQRHLGVFSFLVIGGEHHGHQVFVRSWTREVYEQLWCNGTFHGYDRDAFERHVLAEVGIVHDGAGLVDEPTMLAVWQALQPARARNPQRYVSSVALGYFDGLAGWVRSPVEAIPVPVAIVLDQEDWPEEFSSLKVVSLPQRHRDLAAQESLHARD